jgi:hypothetical protein
LVATCSPVGIGGELGAEALALVRAGVDGAAVLEWDGAGLELLAGVEAVGCPPVDDVHAASAAQAATAAHAADAAPVRMLRQYGGISRPSRRCA